MVHTYNDLAIPFLSTVSYDTIYAGLPMLSFHVKYFLQFW
jgi:hypothetical protein